MSYAVDLVTQAILLLQHHNAILHYMVSQLLLYARIATVMDGTEVIF
jgi:hypothetical protein